MRANERGSKVPTPKTLFLSSFYPKRKSSSQKRLFLERGKEAPRKPFPPHSQLDGIPSPKTKNGWNWVTFWGGKGGKKGGKRNCSFWVRGGRIGGKKGRFGAGGTALSSLGSSGQTKGGWGYTKSWWASRCEGTKTRWVPALRVWGKKGPFWAKRGGFGGRNGGKREGGRGEVQEIGSKRHQNAPNLPPNRANSARNRRGLHRI